MAAPLQDSKGFVGIAEDESALPPVPPVLDTNVFELLLGALAGDLDIVGSIYRSFLGTAGILIDNLPDQDCAAQAATLQTLSNSASMIGAVRMARLAAHLHGVAAKSIHPVIKTRSEELTGELNIFRTAINAHVRSFQYRPRI